MELLKAIHTRKTTNGYFDSRSVSIKDQHTLVEAASRAPSHFNSQPWRFMLIEDKNIINEISKISGAAMTQLLEGTFFTRYRKYFRFSKEECLEKGDGIYFDKFPKLLRPFIRKVFTGKSKKYLKKLGISRLIGKDNEKLVNGSPLILVTFLTKEEYKKDQLCGFYSLLGMGMAIENIWLTCGTLGLGIQFISTPMEFKKEVKKIYKLLKIPKDLELIAMYRIGYLPKGEKRPRIDWSSDYRKPLEKFVFRNTCDVPEKRNTEKLKA